MVYVISDLHGYPFDSFLCLLKMSGFCDDDHLYVIGDVVDRGDDGIKYLKWIMEQKNVELLLGNHEDMMRSCDFMFRPIDFEKSSELDLIQRLDLATWMRNGAEPTLKSLLALDDDEKMKILEYLNNLPLYIKTVVNDKQYLFVHSGLGGFSKDKPLDEYKKNDIIWNRPELSDRYYDDMITVFGHTPSWYYGEELAGEIIITDTWIDIDSGAGYGYSPVLLRLDDMKQFTV